MLALSCVGLAGEDLKTLLDAADKNAMVEAYVQRHHAAELTHQAARSGYLPRVELDGSATFIDERSLFDVGETYAGSIKASYTLFDGFRSDNDLDAREAKIAAAASELEGYRKSLSLDIARHYFALLNVRADIAAQEQNRQTLQAQLTRQQRLLEAGITTVEEVERIKAAVANADYTLAQLHYDADADAAELENLCGITITTLEPGSLLPPSDETPHEPDAIKAMKRQAEALAFTALQRESEYLPQVRIEDTYSFYDYRNMDTSFQINRVRKQNKLMIVASMTVFDFAAASEEAEATRAQMLALYSEITYERRRTEAARRLAQRAIERAHTLIHAAELAVSASQKSFEAVEKKYTARVVDYVRYLDALTQKGEAEARYHQAQNGLQMAYAYYYHTAGLDVRDFVE